MYALLDDIVGSARLRAAAAFIAAQPALLYGYGLWTGIKEITSAALIALFAAHLATLVQMPRNGSRRPRSGSSSRSVWQLQRRWRRFRGWVCVARASAGRGCGDRDPGRPAAFATRAAALVAGAAILSIPAIVLAATLYRKETAGSTLTSATGSETWFTR